MRRKRFGVVRSIARHKPSTRVLATKSCELTAASSVRLFPETTSSATKCRSMQAGAALGSAGVSQQAFEHEMGVRVGRIMPARVTPSSEIPIDGAGACDQVHDGRLVGRPIRVKRMRGVFPHLALRHCISKPITCGHHPNGQPGHSVVGPGQAPIGVGNCSFVTPGAE